MAEKAINTKSSKMCEKSYTTVNTSMKAIVLTPCFLRFMNTQISWAIIYQSQSFELYKYRHGHPSDAIRCYAHASLMICISQAQFLAPTLGSASARGERCALIREKCLHFIAVRKWLWKNNLWKRENYISKSHYFH